jgi:hypothetical protein
LFPDKRYEWMQALNEAYDLHNGGAAALERKLGEIESRISHLETELNQRIFGEVKHELKNGCRLEFKASETSVEMGDGDATQTERFTKTTWKTIVERHRYSKIQTIGDLVQEKKQPFLQLSAGTEISTEQSSVKFQFFLPFRHKGYELGCVHLFGNSDYIN